MNRPVCVSIVCAEFLEGGNKCMKFITGYKEVQGNELALYRWIWNAVDPIMVLVVSWVIFMIKRQWKIAWITFPVLGKIVITILTQPATWLMYFLPAYLIGYVMLIYGIMYVICRKRNRTK